MKKNLYYRAMYKRRNLFKEFILSFFLSIASYPRMVIEVFLRKNFGERYFSLATAVTISVILSIVPLSLYGMTLTFGRHFNGTAFFNDYATWYLFNIAFTLFSFIRWQETRRNPSVFDFKRFSLYSGDINPAFLTVKLFGTPTARTIETIYEPLLALVFGWILYIMGQPIGFLIMACRVIYALSYMGAYSQGDHYVMDKIDRTIMDEEIFDVFVEDKDAKAARGVVVRGRKPNDNEVRRKIVESFFEDDEETLTAS